MEGTERNLLFVCRDYNYQCRTLDRLMKFDMATFLGNKNKPVLFKDTDDMLRRIQPRHT